MIKAIRSLYYILFFLTPLIISPYTSELFEFNKVIFIYAVTILIAFLWLLNKIQTNSLSFIKSIIVIPFLIFLISQIIATVYSIDVHTSLFGYYGRFNGSLLSIIAYLTLFYIFLDSFTEEFLLSLLWVSILSSLLVILWGIPGKFGHDLSCYVFTGEFTNTCWTDQFRPAERMFSTLGQPNWLGAYLSVNFFIGLFFLFTTRHNPRDVPAFFYFAYVLLNFAAILFTRSDAALLATAVGFIVFLLCLWNMNKNNFMPLARKIMLLSVGFLVLMLIFRTGIDRIDRQIESITGRKTTTNQTRAGSTDTYSVINNVTDSFDIRKIVWKGAVDIGKAYPLVGSGVETFAYAYYFKRPVEHNNTSEWDYIYNKAHNEYLNYFATTGTIGLLTYLAMVLIIIYLGWKTVLNYSVQAPLKQKRKILLITSLLCSYISILITNFFGFSTTVVNLYFYILAASVIGFRLFQQARQKELFTITIPNNIIRNLFAGFLIALFIFLSFSLVKYYVADLYYAKADSQTRIGEYSEASNLLRTALRLHYEHVFEDKLSYALANLSYLAYYQKEKEAGRTLMDLSRAYNDWSLQASPKNVMYLKTRAKNYYLFYQATLDRQYLDKGVSALLDASALAPTDPKVPYSLALYYSLQQDEEKDLKKKSMLQNKSLGAINDAVVLKRNFEDGYYLKGQLLKKYGQKEEAKKIFQFILEKINPYNEEAKKELL